MTMHAAMTSFYERESPHQRVWFRNIYLLESNHGKPREHIKLWTHPHFISLAFIVFVRRSTLYPSVLLQVPVSMVIT